jgi:hypothetical protein
MKLSQIEFRSQPEHLTNERGEYEGHFLRIGLHFDLLPFGRGALHVTVGAYETASSFC